jgi:hypothetical protein
VVWARPVGDGGLQPRLPQIVASSRSLCLYAGGLWSNALTMTTALSGAFKRAAHALRKVPFLDWSRHEGTATRSNEESSRVSDACREGDRLARRCSATR